jgi:beta-lactamase regulating signal transducer with metallopeptidase domain/beta-lactamase class D
MTNEILSSWYFHQIGWAIVHSVWQGTLLALSLALIFRLFPNLTSNARYAGSCITLALTLVCPLATANLFNAALSAGPAVEEFNFPNYRIANNLEAIGIAVTGEEDKQLRVPSNSGSTGPSTLSGQLEHFFPSIILLWTLGVLIFSLRLGGGFLYTRRLIRFKADPPKGLIEPILSEFIPRLKIKRTVKVFESVLVKVPMTVGWLCPVILLPPSALLGLTPQQLQSIIAHELVHIKRYDFLVNLIQGFVETLLFYHPAARWVSRKIREEREFVCDNLTLEFCGDRVIYARDLTKVSRFGNKSEHLAAASTGGDLGRRIRRIMVGARYQTTSRITLYGVSAIVSLLLIATAISATAWCGKGSSSISNHINLSPKNDENDNSSDTARLNIYGDDLTKEDLQYRKIAVDALKGHRGSAIIMNPQTGEVYTIVNQEWAFRRRWSPASIFKMVTAIAGLEENILNNSEKRFGYDTESPANLTRAIAVSDNDYFRALGRKIGSESLIKYAKQLGFGRQTGINYDGETGGYLPAPESMKDDQLGFTGGNVEVNPLQLAVFLSAIVNGGKILVPQAVKDGQLIVPRERDQISISPDTLAEVKKGLREVVKNGTGKAADISGSNVAGKTGTMINEGSGTGIFTSYSPVDNPSIVVVVALDGEHENGPLAAGVAGKIYEALGLVKK